MVTPSEADRLPICAPASPTSPCGLLINHELRLACLVLDDQAISRHPNHPTCCRPLLNRLGWRRAACCGGLRSAALPRLHIDCHNDLSRHKAAQSKLIDSYIHIHVSLYMLLSVRTGIRIGSLGWRRAACIFGPRRGRDLDCLAEALGCSSSPAASSTSSSSSTRLFSLFLCLLL